MKIGVDLMGGERSPAALFDGVCSLARELPEGFSLVAFVQEGIELSAPPHNVEVCFVSQSISEEESPLIAVRRKKKSSIAVGIDFLKKNQINAFVSTGNTGALIATASLHLPKLPLSSRVALLATLPTATSEVAVLDVGAHISSSPRHLVSYARLGCAYRKALHGLEKCRVGLLNIGTEEKKGTLLVKQAYGALQEAFEHDAQITFVGNVEGGEVFAGKVDVLITDGFTGNVFLKTSEGISSFMLSHLKKQCPKELATLSKTFNYSEHPGALLAGIEGLIVKCHGYSDVSALKNGILGAIDLAQRQILPKIKEILIP